MDERPSAALARMASRNARVLGRAARGQRPAAGVADEDLEGLAAELVGVRERPGDEPLADR